MLYELIALISVITVMGIILVIIREKAREWFLPLFTMSVAFLLIFIALLIPPSSSLIQIGEVQYPINYTITRTVNGTVTKEVVNATEIVPQYIQYPAGYYMYIPILGALILIVISLFLIMDRFMRQLRRRW